MEIREKHVLKDKGEVANLPTVKQLLVSLTWTKKVDLDLMAFFKAKDGREGGVWTNLLGGSLGNLNAFPFIQLSGDAGVGARGGDNEETLKITKLDEIAQLYIVAVNYTDTKSNNQSASFADYDGKVTVLNEAGQAFEVPLISRDNGTVALIATIDNSNPVSATLKMEDSVMFFRDLVSKIPGAKGLA